MHAFFNKWFRIALFNFLVVAAMGVLVRMKIVFTLPFIHQKNLLHAHSHFAFTGWIGLALMIGFLQVLHLEGLVNNESRYTRWLNWQLIAAFGMLCSFPFQGYGLFSIAFSTLAILVSFAFIGVAWPLTSQVSNRPLFVLLVRSSFVFTILSALGVFALSFLMATHNTHQPLYLGSLYFFLHFQYNGAFFAGILALLVYHLPVLETTVRSKAVIALMISCVPAILLSVLWMPIPAWVYALAVASAAVQVVCWIIIVPPFFRAIKNAVAQNAMLSLPRMLWTVSLVAASLRILLQAFSVFPIISNFAFAYRPIVIGYLHLIFLLCISLFFIGWVLQKGIEIANVGRVKTSIMVLLAGMVLNELLLGLQSVGMIGYWPVPYTNEMLLMATVIILSGLILLNLNLRGSKLTA